MATPRFFSDVSDSWPSPPMRAAIRENRDFRSGKRALVTALDISKAHKVLGWLPQIDLRDGLRETVRWYLAKS